MITFLKKYANDSFEKLVNEIHWMDLPFRLKAIFSKLPSGGGDSRPYKVYTALLTQEGTDAPVATVLENTLGDIIWTRDGEGEYYAESDGLFTENKVYTSVTNIDITVFNAISVQSVSSIYLENVLTSNWAYTDPISKLSVEIRVYN